MKNIKKTIIFLLALLTIILIIILIILYKTSNSKYIYESKKDEEARIQNTTDFIENIRVSDSRVDYFIIKNCIEKYISTLNELTKKEEYIIKYGYTEEQFKSQMSENIKMLYNMLDSTFLNYYNIDENKIYSYYNNYNYAEFYIDQIYKIDNSENVKTYFVYGRINQNDEISKYGFIVKIDEVNLTFSLCTYEYMKDNNLDGVNENSDISVDNIQEIENKQYNLYSVEPINDELTIKELFNKYKKNLIYDKEFLYGILNEKYRNKKFNNYDNFLEYIENNSKKLESASLDKYQKNIYEGYTEYICIDTNGNYLTFYETSAFQYSIILDTYTIDSPEFLDKYNSTNEQGKTILNIDKFFKAINNKSYYYAYNCLSDGFKNNYFKSAEDFEKYIKENLYNNNEIEYIEFKEESELCTYRIKIVNADNKDESIEKTIIMKLNDGTDFEMSFNVN